MKARKVWKFLSILSASEHHRWLAYLSFQYENRQEYQQKLAAFLVDSFPSPPDDEDAWNHLYPAEPYNDGRLRKLSGDLTTQLEQFLSFASQQQSPLDQRIHLLRSMIAQADAELFGQTWKKACKDIYKYADSAAEIARYRYELELLNREFRVRHRMKDGAFWVPPQEEWWGEIDSLQKISHLNTALNLYQKLELLVNIENASINSSNKAEVHLFEEYIRMARSHQLFRRLPFVSLYLRLFDLFKGKYVKIDSTIRYLNMNYAGIPSVERNLLFVSLLNSLIVSVSQNQTASNINALLDLYEWGIQKGLLLRDGRLLPAHYKNFIKICLRDSQIERAEAFREKHISFLPDNVRNELPLICKIYIAFARQDFLTVIKTVNQSQFSSVLDEIDARSILLQAHYELKSWDDEWLEGQINRLIRYTKSRKELSEQGKAVYLIQYALLKRLFLASTPTDFKSLKTKLQSAPKTQAIKWIIDQIP